MVLPVTSPLATAKHCTAIWVLGVASPLDRLMLALYDDETKPLMIAVGPLAHPPQQISPFLYLVLTAMFMPEFPGCTKTFPTIRGRGVHHQKAHKNWYDARLQPASNKVRWSLKDFAMLARKEAELMHDRNPRFMNQELVEFFPQRFLEYIKARRKRQYHREMVAAILDTLRNPVVIPEVVEESFPEEDILVFLDALPELESQGFRSANLHDIVGNARTLGKEATLLRLALYLREVFPPPPGRRSQSRASRVPAPAPISKRKLRRRECSHLGMVEERPAQMYRQYFRSDGFDQSTSL